MHQSSLLMQKSQAVVLLMLCNEIVVGTKLDRSATCWGSSMKRERQCYVDPTPFLKAPCPWTMECKSQSLHSFLRAIPLFKLQQRIPKPERIQSSQRSQYRLIKEYTLNRDIGISAFLSITNVFPQALGATLQVEMPTEASDILWGPK